jgi:hypothetical protein
MGHTQFPGGELPRAVLDIVRRAQRHATPPKVARYDDLAKLEHDFRMAIRVAGRAGDELLTIFQQDNHCRTLLEGRLNIQDSPPPLSVSIGGPLTTIAAEAGRRLLLAEMQTRPDAEAPGVLSDIEQRAIRGERESRRRKQWRDPFPIRRQLVSGGSLDADELMRQYREQKRRQAKEASLQ